MFIEVTPLLFGLLVVMAMRLTTNPFRIRFAVTEIPVNTYTEKDLSLPVAITAGGKAQAIEVMKIVTEFPVLVPEPGQTNNLAFVAVRDSQSALISYDDDDCIYRRRIHQVSEDATAIEQRNVQIEQTVIADLTDSDGNGEIMLERTIHVGIKGTGNPAALSVNGYILAHLVELSGEEAAIQAFVDDA